MSESTEPSCNFWVCRKFGHRGLIAPALDDAGYVGAQHRTPSGVASGLSTAVTVQWMCGRTALPITKPLDA